MRGLTLHAKWEPKKNYTPSTVEVESRKVRIGSRVWRFPELQLKEVPTPKIGSEELLIRVKACGVCGSDIHMYERDAEGYMPYPGLVKVPIILGHELSGVVEKVGDQVKHIKEGDMVTTEEMWWCGECIPCRTGFPNYCVNLDEMGFTTNGGFADYVVVPWKYCWKINDLLEIYKSESKAFEAGSVVEPCSVVYHAMFSRAGGFKPGGYIVVHGAGPIGLAAIALSKAAGAGKVIVFEAKAERLELTRKVGADYVFNPMELANEGSSPHEKILEVTEGEGADLQVEAAGHPLKTLPEMEESLAIDGKIAWIGRADTKVPIFLENFQIRGGKLYGSWGHAGHGNFRNVIRLMAAGKIDMTKIISKRYPLDRALEAMQQATKRVDAKIIIKP